MPTVQEYEAAQYEYIHPSTVGLIDSPLLRIAGPGVSVGSLGVSPLNFPPCPRGPGRPKQTRTGAPKSTKKRKESETEPEEEFSLIPPMLRQYCREEPVTKNGAALLAQKTRQNLAKMLTLWTREIATFVDLS